MTINMAQSKLLNEDAMTVLRGLGDLSDFNGARIVVTGGHGMLGGWVVYLLATMRRMKLGSPVSITVLSDRKGPVAPPIWGKLIDPSLTVALRGSDGYPAIPEADFYFHLASPASATEFLKGVDDLLWLNLDVTSAILRNARKGARLLYASSGEVYGEASGSLNEQTVGLVPLDRPRWIYAEAKRIGELLCRSQHELNGSDFIAARIFHSFGPGLRLEDTRVFGNFIASIARREPLTVSGEPSTTRRFAYAADTAGALILLAARASAATVCNVAGPEEVSIGGLAEALTLEFLGPGLPVQYAKVQSEASPVPRHEPDVSYLMSLGWRPAFSTMDAFRRTIAYLASAGEDVRDHS